jgi:hypothetical protein
MGTDALILLDGHFINACGGHHVETRKNAHVYAAMLPSKHLPSHSCVASAAASIASRPFKPSALLPTKSAALCS